AQPLTFQTSPSYRGDYFLCQQNFTTGEDGQVFFAGNFRAAAGARIHFLLSGINRFQQPAP
ncbi:hypothetical protein, partial [Enterobacter hormaechei]|uniref:hypothetical protein n=1 Tax=Enterobacter hormaechei TaxID=158836 RepID=UPI003EB70CB4